MQKILLLVAIALLVCRFTSMPPVVVADEKAQGLPVAPTDVPGASPRVAASSTPHEEWHFYGADQANTKYSPLDQINTENVTTLQVAWRWRSADSGILSSHPDIRTGHYETTPVMVGGVLYASTSLSQVAAIEPQSGATLWIYDPKTFEGPTPPNLGFVHRGVAYWAQGDDQRILVGTGDAYLIALEARTGQPIPTFGHGGRIDLRQGLRRPGPSRDVYGVTPPPIVC